MTDAFFARYFAALDGPDPASSLELVAEDVRFAIHFATGPGRRSGQLTGGKAELADFVAAGDMTGWSHRIVACVRDAGVELVLGETRWDDGDELIGTFVSAAQLDADGRLKRYIVARSPAEAFGLLAND